MLYTRTEDKKYMVGFDLGEKACQISYLASTAPDVLRTFSMIPGQEAFFVPTQITKKAGANLWFVGSEAEEWAKAGGTPVTGLVSLALSGRPVAIEGQEYDPCSLLALFVKRTLALMAGEVPIEKIAVLMFTAERMDQAMAEMLGRVRGFLELPGGEVLWESHAGSFFHFLVRQQPSLYAKGSILCEYDGVHPLKLWRMRFNDRTEPVVAYLERSEHADMTAGALRSPAAGPQSDRRDESFFRIVRQAMPEGEISSVFLIGDGFQERWMKQSLTYICYHRRVFLGNNLYSRGAACGAYLESGAAKAEAERFFYLEEDRLAANVGTVALRRGRSSYCPLMSAGVNWYEASAEQEFYLEGDGRIQIVLTPITGGAVREETLVLEGLPERPDRMTRLRLGMSMTGPDRIAVHLEDLGFGELYPPSDRAWDFAVTL